MLVARFAAGAPSRAFYVGTNFVIVLLGLGVPTVAAAGLVAGVLGAALASVFFLRRHRAHAAVAAEALRVSGRDTARRDEQDRQTAAQLATIVAAVQVLPMGIVVVGADGTELLRNDESASVLGALDTQGELRSDGEVMAGGTLRRLLDRAANGTRGRETLEIVGPPRRSFVVAAEPIGEAINGQCAVVGSVTEVSEQRRADAMRQDFITNVSHELRTPVGAVAILAETLSVETDPTIVARLSARLESEAHRLSAMVDDLLALGSVESGGASEELVPVPELIDEAIERARASAETRHIVVDVDDIGHGLAIHGDRRQLVSALHNLLENALKYSDKGMPVRVDATMRSEQATGATRVAITVVDQGIGIPTRDHERIFERFYRVDRARARDTGGSGLGLAIVRHVTRNHNGEVSVQSTEGEGSTFTLTLPGIARNAPPASAASSTPPSLQSSDQRERS